MASTSRTPPRSPVGRTSSVALDGAQNIFRQRARCWNPPGMNARGRTTLLRRCYRNTKEIVEYAWAFLQLAKLGTVDDDSLDDPTLLVPPESTSPRDRRQLCSSVRPSVTRSGLSRTGSRSFAARASAWSDMVVLYGHSNTACALR